MSLILGLSMKKILIVLKIKDADPLVSMEFNKSNKIPVWSSFICGKGFTSAQAQRTVRGKPGTLDVITDISSYLQPSTTDSLTTGDWTANTGTWPCFIFNPRKELFFQPGVLDTIILMGFWDQVDPSESGTLFGIFDEERNLKSVDPFVSSVPSTNTFTFTRSERFDVNNNSNSYFTVNKQNYVHLSFENKNLATRFIYSPDTYTVLRYTEKSPYTPYDLISAVGGLTTYALAIWFILFGRGKYRSWGLVQRYLLRNSPDAMKKDDRNRLLPVSYEKSREIKNHNNIFVSSSSSKTVSSTTTNPENDRSSLFYFTTSGTPTQSKFNSLSPNSIITSQSSLIKDLNKRIDAKINQKLWFVEQTLNRHYLSGFKLRKYDVDLKKVGLDTSYDEEEEILTSSIAHHNWNNYDSGNRNSDQNNQKHKHSPSLTPSNSQNFENKNINNDYNINSSNPEQLRSQYPNVSIGQVPIEKKWRNSGSGNYQGMNETGKDISTTNGVVTNTNNNLNISVTTLPSSYYSQISQSDIMKSNMKNSTSLSQIQIPPSLQIGNQGKVQNNSTQGSIPSSPSLQIGFNSSQDNPTQGPTPSSS
ncbi:hypothetical protein C1645_760951 [Glomus cerebriforme]|uniref:Uncharacterized protein n=1 Tax=Glomus cerebriforme TaxID=658196 RepID=A0A397T9L1_9GLOM|nr:hypothetical protein C1645_760951 [Glomus cerebriforme]